MIRPTLCGSRCRLSLKGGQLRYLLQFQPNKADQVRAALQGIRVPVVSQVFDYFVLDISAEMVEKVRALPYVVAVTPDRPKTIAQILIPVDRKLAEFQRLFFSNPLTGPPLAFKFIAEADSGKVRIPTSVSRKMVGAEEAEKDGISGKGVKIAVLDTGTGYDFFFQGPYLGGRSSVEGEPVPLDQVGHGVHVQTTISGRPFASIHGLLKGVAVDAEVVAFKVLGHLLGAGTTSYILRGIADALEWKADIVSMSLGGPEAGPDDPENRMISALTKQGMVFAVAAGNSGPDPQSIGTPGDGPDSLTVGAVDIEGKIASFSSRGTTKDGRIKPDIVAPGVNILSTSAGWIALMQAGDGPPALAAISGTCLSGDSLILLDGGYIKRLCEMQVGDLILTPFGRDMVLAFMSQGEAEVYKLDMEDGRSIEATTEHKFLVRSKKGTTWAKPSEYEWRELKELHSGDEVLLYRMTKVEAANLFWQDAVLREQLGDYDNFYIPQLTARGKKNPFYGKHHSKETLEKLAAVLRGRTAWNKGLTLGDDRLRRALELSQSHGFGTYERTPEILKKLSASLKGKKAWNKGIPMGAETRAKLREAQLANLQEPEYHAQVLQWLRDGLEKKLKDAPMTKGETFVVTVLGALFPTEYRFNNGWFRLCGRYPDVVNINGKKKLIEVLGERWHPPEDEDRLRQLYAEVGYDCLILWGREISGDPALAFAKLREFASNDMKDRTKVHAVQSITSIGVKPVYDITTHSHSFVANGFIVHNSMATPHVSGAVALALQYARSRGKSLTTEGIKEAMSLFGDFPGEAKNNDYGHGLLTYSILKRYVDERL